MENSKEFVDNGQKCATIPLRQQEGELQMGKYTLTNKRIDLFKQSLYDEERSKLTIEKYIRDVRAFQAFLGGGDVSKQVVIEYKQHLSAEYKTTSVNSMLAAINRFLEFCGWVAMRVKFIKVQQNMFIEPERELSQDEYTRLVQAAQRNKNERLNLVMQTICSTGIRVSELRYITVEFVRHGRGEVVGKGKRRTVLLTPKLKDILTDYAKKCGIKSGPVFLSRNGNPLNRHGIWADMKALCDDAGVDPRKVFPHNLRHLFARTFYAIEKDVLRLADILGHSSVNTTRIYTAECGVEHIKVMQQMPLLL